MGGNVITFFSDRISGAWAGAGSVYKEVKTGAYTVKEILKESGETVEDSLKLTKTIVAFLLIGWWLAPIWGLGTCIAYAFYLQIQFTLFMLFGSLKGKGAEAARSHISNNRFGLTFMVVIMTAFSALKSLTPATNKPLIMTMLVALLAFKCCT